MTYVPDIDLGKTWLVSDTHFGHENIKDYCDRPQDVEQRMMEAWAREVPEDATVIHLGDLSYKSNALFKNVISKHLTGARKFIILGNHDRQRFSFYRDSGFRVIKPFTIHLAIDSGPMIVPARPFASAYLNVSLSHYPWSEKEEGRPMHGWELRIHGHIHNNGYSRTAYVPFLKSHINISVEQTHYRPVNLLLLLEGAVLGVAPA